MGGTKVVGTLYVRLTRKLLLEKVFKYSHLSLHKKKSILSLYSSMAVHMTGFSPKNEGAGDIVGGI